jgi:hypothetical protein
MKSSPADTLQTVTLYIRGQPRTASQDICATKDWPTLPASHGHLHACLTVQPAYTIDILRPATFPSVFSAKICYPASLIHKTDKTSRSRPAYTIKKVGLLRRVYHGGGPLLLVPAVSFRRTSKLSQVLAPVAAHTVETSCLTASVPGVQPVGLADSLWPRGQVHKVIYEQHLSLWAFHGLKGRILQGLLKHISDDSAAAKHTVVICGLEYGEEAELYASEGFKTIVFEPLAAWADKFLERITEDVAKRVVLHKVGAAVQRRYVYFSQWLLADKLVSSELSTCCAAERTRQAK